MTLGYNEVGFKKGNTPEVFLQHPGGGLLFHSVGSVFRCVMPHTSPGPSHLISLSAFAHTQTHTSRSLGAERMGGRGVRRRGGGGGGEQ